MYFIFAALNKNYCIMKHTIKVNGSPVDIELFVSVVDKETNEIVDEGFDSFREANLDYPRSLFRFVWTAARIIDDFGNLDFPVYGGRYMQRAISKLIEVLS